ncbi:nucleotidyltransferase domain-containing protein [Paenibacillus campinasensis]|uniref:Nucleotidyltransferase domain-containing protein n=1 Tax=Paenibacillus campinasensis TaxID=66347 RepID=A0ABW9T4J8_9BACL|nr:nucleotidyltransferase domain-containing protein [Paenibacillus campinasensis]MUG68012.1 nucleotidyltransferase domain-containing protein [Paenibacillus campinasensis]
MMILKAGYGLDPSGCIISDVSINKIDSKYQHCIEEAVERLKSVFQEQLHSVYVYGSVARGEAVEVQSDLDLIAMFYGKQDSMKLAELKQLSGDLSEPYRYLVRDVGIAAAFYDYTMDPSNYYENAFLRELCVCVYGEDIGRHFGPYKLTSEIAISFNGDIGQSLARTLTRIETASVEELQSITQGFARKLIRTYYSMVMARSQIWTTRLLEQCEVFLQHFPDKEPIIRTLLSWIDEPPASREAVVELFKNEGEWARVNFEREASKVN